MTVIEFGICIVIVFSVGEFIGKKMVKDYADKEIQKWRRQAEHEHRMRIKAQERVVRIIAEMDRKKGDQNAGD